MGLEDSARRHRLKWHASSSEHYRLLRSTRVIDWPSVSIPGSRSANYGGGRRDVCMSLDVVPLGGTGMRVTDLALGTWRFGRERDGDVEIDRERAMALLDAYAGAGGTFIDTADFYGDGRAESWIGEWLAERDRASIVIASKVFWPTREDDPNARGLGRKHLRRSID